MSSELLAIGADGDKRGWVAAVQDASGATRLEAFADVTALWNWRSSQPGGATARVLIDVPIGLPAETGFRACDEQARALLGKRRSSVFQPPGRYLLAACEDGLGATAVFARVRELVAERRSAASDPDAVSGLSAQAAGILRKVQEVDAFLGAGPARDDVLAECHPEVSFALMGRGEPLPAKASALGQLMRLDLVRAEFPDSEDVIRAWTPSEHRSLLDILDAYAALWSALRWGAGGGGATRRRRTRPRDRPADANGRVSRDGRHAQRLCITFSPDDGPAVPQAIARFGRACRWAHRPARGLQRRVGALQCLGHARLRGAGVDGQRLEGRLAPSSWPVVRDGHTGGTGVHNQHSSWAPHLR